MHCEDNKLINRIISLHKGQRSVIGIDGLSRSGKTTLAKQVQEKLIRNGKSVCTIHMDHHIVERQKRYNTGHDQWYEYYQLQWDVQNLRDTLFAKIHNYKEIQLPFYDSELDACTMRTIDMPNDSIIIIECVFLQRKEWADFFDFIVYLDYKKEDRFLRESVSSQQDIEKFRIRYWMAENYYLNVVQPLSRADMVIES